jgi:hypothetical protein
MLIFISLLLSLLWATLTYAVALIGSGVRSHWSDPYNLRPNPLYPYARSPVPASSRDISYLSRFWKDPNILPSRTRSSKPWAAVIKRRQDAYGTAQQDLDLRPTPEPTGESSASTTVFVVDQTNFALLLPTRAGGMSVLATSASSTTNSLIELISDAEMDAETYCTPGNNFCTRIMPEGFIRAASVVTADDGSWIQV